MARDISAPALAEVVKQFRGKPSFIIEISWADGQSVRSYSDAEIPGIPGKIMDVSSLDAVIAVSQNGDSQELDVVLSDTDGDIKTILDTNDIHKRPCWVYQWYAGLDLTEKFLLFKGLINTPIVWNEGKRQVSITIINEIESTEVGFSIDEGNFINPPEDLIGQPWPLCFGTCINVPALRIKALQSGTLMQGVGIKDPTLKPRLDVAELLSCARVPAPPPDITLGVPDPACLRQICEIKESLQLQYDEQRSFEFNTFDVLNGEKFPQGVQIWLDIDGAKFRGSFSGTTFTVTARRHPSIDDNNRIEDTDEQAVIESECGVLPLYGGTDNWVTTWQAFNDIIQDPDLFNDLDKLNNAPNALRHQLLFNITAAQTDLWPERRLLQAEEERSRVTFDFFSKMPALSFHWAQAGSTVTLDSNREIIYVANIISSDILQVAAFRTLRSGARILATVPEEWYTVRQVDYNGYDVMEIVFDRPLSQRGNGWESDDIYVTLTSAIGPNTVDILEWLIETYTDFGIDTTSFDAVRTAIDNYPSHFPILDRPNILDLLQDIAFQARCAIWLRNDTFFIRYLAEYPTTVETITHSDMAMDTMELFHTPTEELVTKYVAEWKRDYSIDDWNKTILRYNVKKYGTHEETKQFFIYNIYELVQKSATFWLIRKANTWRKMRFQTALNKLRLETLDVTDLTSIHLADTAVPATIEVAEYDSNSRRLNFEVWTPVRSGERTIFDFAYPQDIDENTIWPTLDDRQNGFAGSGRAPNFSVIAPSNHPLVNPPNYQVDVGESCQDNDQQHFTGSTTGCRGDYGDTQPSDVGDVKPNVPVPSNSGAVNAGSDPLFNAPGIQENCCAIAKQAMELAQKAMQQVNSDKTAEDEPDDTLPQECGGNCKASYKITYVIPTTVRPSGGAFTQEIGESGGLVAKIDTRIECRTFDNDAAMIADKDSTQAGIDARDADPGGWINGTESAWLINNVTFLGLDNKEYNADGSANSNFGQRCIQGSKTGMVGKTNETL